MLKSHKTIACWYHHKTIIRDTIYNNVILKQQKKTKLVIRFNLYFILYL